MLRQRRAIPKPLPIPHELLASNSLFRGKHGGHACVILGNGPSAKELDLSALTGKIVISVSNGYFHRDYQTIAPRYHCVPQITYGRMTEADTVLWFEEMHAHLGDAELFLNETEENLVRRHDLFHGRKVHYVAFRESFDELSSPAIPDLTKPIPRIESVPIMALMIAMYLGFDKIAMLGVDHDHFKSKQYVYAFDLKVQAGKDFSVTQDGDVQTPWHDEFQSLARLWRQYRAIGRIAAANNITIVNATPGGELDEFPRIAYRQWLEHEK
ncbi:MULTISPECIES: hypothetical protein [unclassified Herbaspirillum]|uniref:hypothetical protein n=1 Tax=unclassified Herbaspirillum TaxID=2624150 RepID=UPI0018F50E05|nr:MULTISPECIES: hypothetical protein [unclassified Herbaspirillum]